MFFSFDDVTVPAFSCLAPAPYLSGKMHDAGHVLTVPSKVRVLHAYPRQCRVLRKQWYHSAVCSCLSLTGLNGLISVGTSR
jgi:hypothetical protein